MNAAPRVARGKSAPREDRSATITVTGIQEARLLAVSYKDGGGQIKGIPVVLIGNNVCLPAESQFVLQEPDKTPPAIAKAVLDYATTNKDGFEQV